MTLAAFSIAIATLATFLFVWWRSGHKVKDLIWQVIAPMCMGILMGACGGLIGKAAGFLGSAHDVAGGLAAGGTGVLQGQIATTSTGSLTPGGAVVTVALLAMATISLIAAAKAGGGKKAVQLVLLAAAGITLYATVGGSGWGDASVIAAVNAIGEPLLGWANGG
ncbi:hypothetical protein [Streptomyces otsuchiensis]|uniref:hypothetical protein n=1 Tax=Streptomyces otsuchiensis TaxID=2681388 RepID=UPI001031330C|nr:hypothetical protein [Streptomyces otsuchiensis]